MNKQIDNNILDISGENYSTAFVNTGTINVVGYPTNSFKHKMFMTLLKTKRKIRFYEWLQTAQYFEAKILKIKVDESFKNSIDIIITNLKQIHPPT